MYILKVLKHVILDVSISSKAMGIMKFFINDIFEKLAQVAAHFALAITRSYSCCVFLYSALVAAALQTFLWENFLDKR